MTEEHSTGWLISRHFIEDWSNWKHGALRLHHEMVLDYRGVDEEETTNTDINCRNFDKTAVRVTDLTAPFGVVNNPAMTMRDREIVEEVVNFGRKCADDPSAGYTDADLAVSLAYGDWA